MEGGGEDIEESVGLVRRGSWWVDGSEVDSESLPWCHEGDGEGTHMEGQGMSVRRRLVKKPKRADSLDVEAMGIADAHKQHHKDLSIWNTLAMAFQTLGVVYGDMGTSPLYVFSDVFSKVPSQSEIEVLGALSLVMYTIALIPFAKYVFVVLKANDNGEGGTFALYSLICRYAKVNLLPNQQRADEHISSYKLKLPTPELERALNIKENLEQKSSLKTLLLLLVLMGTSMVIGDGILTPAMSVMSAVSGLQGSIPGFNSDHVVLVSIVILVGLFSIQRFGTGKVGFLFAPALALWFFSLGSIGIYNIIKYDISVLRGFNPAYIYFFFNKNNRKAWSALGGCVLCITGIAEVGVMLVSTTLVTLVMLLIWQTNLFFALSFPAIFGTIELIYLFAVLTKVLEGGWLPLAFASCFLCIMYTWNYGSVLKYQSEIREKISMDFMLDLGSNLGTVRVPGIGLLYNELVQGIPSIFGQFLVNLPAIHSTIVFVCIKYVPIPVVPQEERFLFRRVCPKDYHMFRCIARYGYKDIRKEDHHAFERLLVESLEKFLRMEAHDLALENSALEMHFENELGPSSSNVDELRVPLLMDQQTRVGAMSTAQSNIMLGDEDPSLEYELSDLREAMDSGFTYLLAHGDVRARKESWFLKKLFINYFYAFLRRNCRAGPANMSVPHMNIIQVGMTYMV
ncbi:putative potassium transporter 12 [Acorus gramineus]|uniref:Potassium transporter 12 n=1 Tax=Acorus gramineus TaxID=55184 RepID=A0AAV9BD23_ACOGR|nr:putative potassium transporter 12 [Acorus gramineus]